jgi:hypothetical protein
MALVMPGLVPGIHVLCFRGKDVDGRDISAFTRVFRRAMPGHDAVFKARPDHLPRGTFRTLSKNFTAASPVRA